MGLPQSGSETLFAAGSVLEETWVAGAKELKASARMTTRADSLVMRYPFPMGWIVGRYVRIAS